MIRHVLEYLDVDCLRRWICDNQFCHLVQTTTALDNCIRSQFAQVWKERLTSRHCGRSVCNSDCHFWQRGYGRALVQPWKVFERRKEKTQRKGRQPVKIQSALARVSFFAWNFPSGTKVQSAERIAATVEIARVSDKKKSYQLRVRTFRRPVELGGRFYRQLLV